MGRGKKHTPEQIAMLLRQIEVGVANGKTTPAACREVDITEQTVGASCRSLDNDCFRQEYSILRTTLLQEREPAGIFRVEDDSNVSASPFWSKRRSVWYADVLYQQTVSVAQRLS